MRNESGTTAIHAGRWRRGRTHLRLPLFADAPLSSFELTLRYDADALAPTAVRRTSAAEGAHLAANLDTPGMIRIALASAVELDAQDSPQLNVEFERLANGRLTAPVVQMGDGDSQP
jgi:hypothetical protein